MKVWIDQEEWWPVYTYWVPTDEASITVAVEVPDELLKEYDAARKAFNTLQGKLEEYHKCQN